MDHCFDGWSGALHLSDSVLHTTVSSSLRYVVKNQATAVAALALASILGGALEAAFLVIVTRTTFAVSENRSDVDTFAGATATVTVALTLALGVVILRIIASVAGSWQSAQLSSRLVASIRNQLASAFLRASWDAQHQNRSGRLHSAFPHSWCLQSSLIRKPPSL